MCISITGLKPKSFLGFLRFWTLAIPSYRQAETAKGNLHSSVKRIKGYQCTVTAWENREMMLEFMRNGAHLKAMQAFHKIATGKTYGYEAEAIPDWNEAFSLLESNGRVY